MMLTTRKEPSRLDHAVALLLEERGARYSSVSPGKNHYLISFNIEVREALLSTLRPPNDPERKLLELMAGAVLTKDLHGDFTVRYRETEEDLRALLRNHAA